MANPPNFNQSSGIVGPHANGSTVVSVHTERKVRIFAVHEPELDALSYLNTATTGLCGLATLFIPYFLENVRKAELAYKWYLDPYGWAIAALIIAASFAIFFKRGITKKIKQDATII